MELKGPILSASFQWSFDKHGGAIGSIDTGIQIPRGAVPILYVSQPIVNVVGAGGAFSLGWAANLTAIGATTFLNFLTTQVVTTLPQGATTANSVPSIPSIPVLFTIGGAPLTAGVVNVFFHYTIIY